MLATKFSLLQTPDEFKVRAITAEVVKNDLAGYDITQITCVDYETVTKVLPVLKAMGYTALFDRAEHILNVRRLNSEEISSAINRQMEIFKMYKYCEGGTYLTLCIAEHSETKEKLVIYKRVGGKEGEIFAMPVQLFKGLVPTDMQNKYGQTYMFEEIKE